MGLVVITGGARSGKSRAAQRLSEGRAAQTGVHVFVAVFGRAEGDPEMAARIDRHRSDRPVGFETLEATDPLEWRNELPEDSLLLLDCLGTLTGLAMERQYERPGGLQGEHPDTSPCDFEAELDETLSTLVTWLRGRPGDTIVVTNEVGMGVVPAYASGRVFRDVLGRANAALIASADAAYLAIGGRLVDMTALPADIDWPT